MRLTDSPLTPSTLVLQGLIRHLTFMERSESCTTYNVEVSAVPNNCTPLEALAIFTKYEKYFELSILSVVLTALFFRFIMMNVW